MQVYKESEIKAVLAIFSAFNIKVEVDSSKPNEPMVIHAKLFQRKNGEYCDEPEEIV
jgi:hypothetical protein